MSKQNEIEDFERKHSHPDQAGVASLFRFSRATIPIEHLRLLFVERKLYHALPSQFNDPFECKPHFRWPDAGKEVRRIRKHLIRVARRQGMSKKQAEATIARNMVKKDFVQDAIYQAITKTLGEIRVCSFTSSKENLLFWAHYTDSHRGFCVEYDAAVLPISYAFKVHYSELYPEVNYPPPIDVRALRPALIKSNDWAYEEEFRTILVTEAKRQPKNDGTSLILSGNEITNVYFGAYMEDAHKQVLLELVNQGPFNPAVWQARLSPSAFELHFESIENIEA